MILYATRVPMVLVLMIALVSVTGVNRLSAYTLETENIQSAIPTAEAGVRFNRDNWHTNPHPQPDSFVVTKLGELYGTTTTGIPFSQINIDTVSSARVQKFIIQDHYHYIVNGKIAYTKAELFTLLADYEVRKIAIPDTDRNTYS